MAINLGDVNFRLGADDRALKGSVRELQKFGNTVDRITEMAHKSNASLVRQFQRQEKAAADAVRQVQALNARLRQTQAGAQHIDAVNSAFKKYNATLTSANLSTNDFRRNQLEFKSALGDVQRQTLNTVTATNGFGGALRRASQSAVLIHGPLGGIATRLTVLAAVAESTSASMAALFAGMALGAFVVFKLGISVIGASNAMERYQVALLGITGTQAIANGEIQRTTDIANDAGLRIQDVIPAYTKWAAATKDTGIQGQIAADIFQSIARVSGQLQLPLEQTQGVFKALEQIMSKGVVQAEELRGQLGDRLPGAFQIAARAMGVTTAELAKMTKEGKLQSEVFLPRFAKELEKTYGTNTIGMIDTVTAAQNRMSNNFFDLLTDFGKLTNAVEKQKTVFNTLAGAIFWVRENLVLLGKVAAVAAALMTGLVGGQILAGFALLARGIWATAGAVVGLNSATMLPGIVGMVNLMAGAVVAMILFQDELNAIISPLERMEILALTAAAAFGTILVAALAGAVMGMGGLAAAALILRGALLRTGIFAIVVLAAELVFQFTRLVTAAGSVGAAWQLLVNVGKELWERVGFGMQAFLAGFDRLTLDMKVLWFSAIQFLQTKWAAFIGMVANGSAAVGRLVPGLDGVVDSLSSAAHEADSLGSSWDGLILRTERSRDAAALNEAAWSKMANAPLASLGKINSLLNQVTNTAKTPLNLPLIPNGGGIVADTDTGVGGAKAQKAIDQYNKKIEDLFRNIIKLGASAAELKEIERAMEIDATLDKFSKKMLDAGFSIEFVNAKMADLQALMEQEDTMEDWAERVRGGTDKLQGALTGGIDDLTGALGESLMEWNGSLDAMADAAENTAKDIINTLIQLTVSNPLKNLLFGLNTPTLEGGSGGLGGLLGGLLGGGGGAGIPPGAIARNGAVFNQGKMTKMAKGGILNRPTIMNAASGTVLGGEAGQEAIMPLTRNSSGQLGVMQIGGGGSGMSQQAGTVVNVITPPGTQTEKKQRRDSSGNQITDIIITTVNNAALGGKLDKGVGTAFNLQRGVKRR